MIRTFRFSNRFKKKILTTVFLATGCAMMTGCNAPGQARDAAVDGRYRSHSGIPAARQPPA